MSTNLLYLFYNIPVIIGAIYRWVSSWPTTSCAARMRPKMERAHPEYNYYIIEPDRVEISYYNEKFVNNAVATVRRSSRRGDYVGNVDFILKHVWINNITIDIIMYEYLSNTFKRSFVEFHFKWCNMIDMDMIVGAIIAKTGLKCPTLPGNYSLKNISLGVDIPYVPPFEAGKADITIKTTYGETVGHGFVVGHVQKKNVKQKQKL